LNPHGSERQHYSISPPKMQRKSAKGSRRICGARLYSRRALEESAEQSNQGAKEKVSYSNNLDLIGSNVSPTYL
jgi:hypothetical protein